MGRSTIARADIVMGAFLSSNSIRNRLVGAFLLLAIGPLLLAGLVLAVQESRTQVQQAKALQTEIARRAAQEIGMFTMELEAELALMTRIQELLDIPAEEQRGILSRLRSYKDERHRDVVEEIALLNGEGKEITRVSRISVVWPRDLRDRSRSDEFRIPRQSKEIYYGHVHVDNRSGQPIVGLGVPILDPMTGAVRGVLAAELRMTAAWNKIEQIKVGRSGVAYVLDEDGYVVAHPNRSVVLRHTRFGVPENSDVRPGLDGQRSVVASEKLVLGKRVFHVVTELPLDEALAPTVQRLIIVLFAILLAVSGALALGAFAIKRVIMPVENLANVARAISAGEHERKASVEQPDEIGALAESLNAMADSLVGMIASLEEQVEVRKKTEERLRETLAEQQVIFDNASEGICLTQNRVLTRTNRRFCEIFGYAEEDLIGMTTEMLYPSKEAYEELGKQAYQNVKAGKVFVTERLMARADGSRFWCHFSGSAVDIADADRGTIWIAEDISERKAAEQALGEYHERLKAVRDIGALAASSLDIEKVLNSILEGTLRACGGSVGMIYLRDPATGQFSLGAAIGLSQAYIREYTDRPVEPGEGLTGSIGESGEPIYIPGNTSGDPRITRQVARDEDFNSFIGVPLRASGRIVGVMNVMTRPPAALGEDETALVSAIGTSVGSAIRNATLFAELKKTEDRIRAQHEFLNNVLESLTLPFYIVDAETYRIKLANSKAGFGVLTEASTCYALTHGRSRPCDDENHPCTVQEIRRTGQPVIVEHTHLDPEGNPRYFEVHGYPIKDEQGRVTEVIEYSLDVTTRKSQEQELRKRSVLESMGRLSLGVAHEVNNPLTNASLTVQILRKRMKKFEGNGVFLQKLDTIERNIDRAATIARELLTFSRQQQIDLINVDLRDVLKSAVDTIGFRLERVSIENRLSGKTEVFGDPGKLEQVFINILTNAAEAMPEGGTIVVSNTSRNGHMTVDFTDTGCGVAEQDRRKVFDPFFTTKEIGQGTGLGLSICYGIITQHGGTIEMLSGEGKGTTVRINLLAVEGEHHDENSHC